jgi:hypothetical protein
MRERGQEGRHKRGEEIREKREEEKRRENLDPFIAV